MKKKSLTKYLALLTTSVFSLTYLFLIPFARIEATRAQDVDIPIPTHAVVGEKRTSKTYIPTGASSTYLKTSDGEDALLIKDYLTTTKFVESAAGSESQDYHPYGTTSGKSNSYSDKQFTGHRNLEDTGVYHAGARFYNPQLGMFIQADKKQGPNRYAYVANNPISNNDPTGNFCIPCIVGIIALVGMMTTSPMGSTEADTPGEVAQVQNWENTGGPEFSYAMSRMVPGLGQAMGVTELASGTDALGRDVSPLGQVLNVVDVAGMSLAGAGRVNGMAGELNTTIQQRRIMALDGATEIFPNGLDAANQLARSGDIEGMATTAMNRLNLTEVGIYSAEDAAAKFNGAGGFYTHSADGSVKSMSLTWGSPEAAPHEIVHALQDASGHPIFRGNRTFSNIMDAENMAYAGTNRANDNFLLQMSGTAWSTGRAMNSAPLVSIANTLRKAGSCNCGGLFSGARMMSMEAAALRGIVDYNGD